MQDKYVLYKHIRITKECSHIYV